MNTLEIVVEGPHSFAIVFGFVIVILGCIQLLKLIKQYAPDTTKPFFYKLNYCFMAGAGLLMSVSGLLLLIFPWAPIFGTTPEVFRQLSYTFFVYSFYPLVILGVIYVGRSIFSKRRQVANP